MVCVCGNKMVLYHICKGHGGRGGVDLPPPHFSQGLITLTHIHEYPTISLEQELRQNQEARPEEHSLDVGVNISSPV